jgi:hypothetical protein
LRPPFRDDFRDGTFAPFSRASLSPMAIACLRLVTRRPDPLFNVPFFFRRIADSTVFDAAFPYFAMRTSVWTFANAVLKRLPCILMKQRSLPDGRGACLAPGPCQQR